MSDDCCKRGFEWEGKPVGTEGTLAGNKAYITGTNKHAAVLMIHDIYGWTFTNLRLLADHFAKEANVTVYLPDYFGGEVLPEQSIISAFSGDSEKMKELDLPSFFTRHGKEPRGPEIFAAAKTLRAQYSKVGAIGYCYGGWGCFQLAAKGNNLVDCVSVAHPSFLANSEIDTLSVPVQIIAPENDPQLTPELKEYCNKVIPTLGIKYQYDYYPGLAHGFAGRGNPNDAVQKEGLERAKNSMVTWLNEFLH